MNELSHFFAGFSLDASLEEESALVREKVFKFFKKPLTLVGSFYIQWHSIFSGATCD